MEMDNLCLEEGLDELRCEIFNGAFNLPDQLFVVAEDENTLPADMKYSLELPIGFQPVTPRGPPCRTEMKGNYMFELEISAAETHRNKFLYSSKLNRIYVNMKINFSVRFNYDFGQYMPFPLYVRATVVYSDESQAHTRVEKCIQHTHEAGSTMKDPNCAKNVLNSAREPGTPGVYYCGDETSQNCWYSVLMEVDSPQPWTHVFKFTCKSSCSSGINRRPIDIIFTLEDAHGRVYGRKLLGARVCSCPRRDMFRDETVEEGKRRVAPAAAPSQPPTKKIKLEVVPDSQDVVTLPPLKIIGTKAVTTGLNVMLSMMEQAAQLQNSDQSNTKYNENITALKNFIQELETPKTPE